ncbi:adenosylmethionine decarboxylase [Epibacterium ulvae]|uniref:adenosylmethionine decarboxylase n=1 Tax=Epibacterium ulvae TaxID=1156985 RepID=UPI001BFC861C|nr:adenosylmethionine decarboxylase [Epibacterium ulvae]MBT8156016.1 adenosylmethionine decarboxylase [Epibacterium ulvae]
MTKTPPTSLTPASEGLHLIVDVRNGRGLNDPVRLEQAFHTIVEVCGATLLHCHIHPFTPEGLSGVALLAESHISAHTWPDQGYGAFDVFMCGAADPWAAIDVLKSSFETEDVTAKAIRRSAVSD